MPLAGSRAGPPEDPLATSSGATRGRQRKPSLPCSQLQEARPEGARAEGHGLHDHHPHHHDAHAGGRGPAVHSLIPHSQMETHSLFPWPPWCWGSPPPQTQPLLQDNSSAAVLQYVLTSSSQQLKRRGKTSGITMSLCQGTQTRSCYCDSSPTAFLVQPGTCPGFT